MKKLSDKYLLLPYYVHSYLESVRHELIFTDATTVENFRENEANEKQCQIVFEHSLTQWNYELSWNQVANGIALFLKCQRQLVEKDRWISIKDRLPELGEEFNVIVDLNDGMDPVASCADWNAIKKEWFYIGTEIKMTGVTHWQPLPTPPTNQKP